MTPLSRSHYPDDLPASPRLRVAWSVAYWLLLLAGCAAFMVMNFYTTLKEDDFFHSLIGGDGRPIGSVADVVRSWLSYMRYDARTANLPDFLFNGLLGKTAFNVCNTLVFGLMAHLVSRLATGRNSVMALALLYCYIIAALPVPGETMLWVAGSCNYMWAFTASLAFVACVLRAAGHLTPSRSWLLAVLMLVVSFFVGGANEGTTLGVWGGMLLYFLINRDRVNRTVVIAMTGYLLGIILLVSCPGAWQRAALEVSHQGSVVQLLAERARLIGDKAVQFVTPAVALLIGLIAIVRQGFRKTLGDTPWPFIFLIMLAFVFVLNKNHDRLYFSVAMAAFVILVLALHRMLVRWPWLRVLVTVAALALCAYKYPANVDALKRYKAFFEQAEADISSVAGDQVILKARTFDGYSRFIKLFNFDSWNVFIREPSLCSHYGKSNIQFVNDTIYARYHDGRLLEGGNPVPFTVTGDRGDIQSLLAFPDHGYLALQMRQDSVSHSYQFATALTADGTPMLMPVSYFPVLYQGHQYLIFPVLGQEVATLVFSPYALDGPTISLHPSTGR